MHLAYNSTARKWLMGFIAVLLSTALLAQTKSINLSECHENAQRAYPALQQSGLLRESFLLTESVLNSSFLPALTLSGQAGLQSAVTEIPAVFPGLNIPEMSKDQYRILAEVSQLLYDGGITNGKKKMEATGLEAELQQNEADREALKERVTTVYFSILLLRCNEKITGTYLKDLNARYQSLIAAANAGASMQMAADLILAERIKVFQQQLSVRADIQLMHEILSALTGSLTDSSFVLQLPAAEITAAPTDYNRPELKMFTAQAEKAASIKTLNNRASLPRISLFGQAGYGRPALNMLSDNFEPYYIIGARFSWNFGNLWSLSAENKKADIRRDLILLQKDTWILNQKIKTNRELNEISKLQALIAGDEALLEIRRSILTRAEEQLRNGTLSATEYIGFTQAAAQAEANMELHKIQLAQAKYNYISSYGKK